MRFVLVSTLAGRSFVVDTLCWNLLAEALFRAIRPLRFSAIIGDLLAIGVFNYLDSSTCRVDLSNRSFELS